MKKLNASNWLPAGALLLAAQFAGAQSLLNENFDGPGLPGWQVYGESSGLVNYDVSGGSLNVRGTVPTVAQASQQLRRDLLSASDPAPTSWQFETRFFLPQATANYTVPIRYSDGRPAQTLFALFGTNNQNTAGIVNLYSGQNFIRTEAALNQWHTLAVAVTPSSLVGYLNAVAIGTLGVTSPTAIRTFFTDFNVSGSSMQSNPIRVDRITIVPEPTSFAVLGACLSAFLVRRRRPRGDFQLPNM